MKVPAGVSLAPMTFAPGNTGTPLLMMMGRTDGFYSVEDAQQLFTLIKSAVKELEIYESGHRLPAE